MDEIEFGQVEYREPESQVRPDRNGKYSVVGCGPAEPADLPIFVDLDVMRDMEGHARTNTHVELGGVLLGGKFVDDEGQSFVVIREALRAEHYEATRGSFKFTHETWAQITRDREQFPADLLLVGWYHTHPDWGVFLSGMDMFICDNFFADSLDVALVIDPCRGDRGWFFWDHSADGRQKRRVSGFYLFANRYRRTELLQFADALAVTNPAYFDPRYETPMGESAMQPVVHIHDQKSPVLVIAVLGMLTMQMLVFSLIAWRVLFPASEPVDVVQNRRNEIYREVLGQMVESSPGGKGVVERVERLADENAEMQTDLRGRGLLVDELTGHSQKLATSLQAAKEDLVARREAVRDADATIATLKKDLATEQKVNEDIKEGKTIGGLAWWIAGSLAAATALAGLFGGIVLGRYFAGEDEDAHLDRGYPVESKLPPVGEPSTPPPPDVSFGESTDPSSDIS